jgi:hypothetical protein
LFSYGCRFLVVEVSTITVRRHCESYSGDVTEMSKGCLFEVNIEKDAEEAEEAEDAEG